MGRSAESMKRKQIVNAEYDKTHTKQIKCKLNLKTDADILEYLAVIDNTQGYIKRLIREDIARSSETAAE